MYFLNVDSRTLLEIVAMSGAAEGGRALEGELSSGGGTEETIRLLKEKIGYLEKNLPDICQQHLLWRGCSQMSFGEVRPHIVTIGNHIYVGGGNAGKMEFTRTVMKYDLTTGKWSLLPISAYYTFSMVAIKGVLTIIGGSNVVTACVSNALTSYEEDRGKWGAKFPPMPTKRCATSAVSTAGHVVVVGGISDSDSAYLDIVETLDMSCMEWNTVCPFPIPVTFMSITACSTTGRMFLLGGLSHEGAMRSVFSCSVSDLVASSGKTDAENRKDNVWRMVCECPYFRSGGVTIEGKLVVASGIDDAGEVTTTMHCFDPVTEKWTDIGEMPSARSSCSIAVLTGGQILIAGGYFKPRNWIGSLTKDAMATVNLKVL